MPKQKKPSMSAAEKQAKKAEDRDKKAAGKVTKALRDSTKAARRIPIADPFVRDTRSLLPPSLSCTELHNKRFWNCIRASDDEEGFRMGLKMLTRTLEVMDRKIEGEEDEERRGEEGHKCKKRKIGGTSTSDVQDTAAAAAAAAPNSSSTEHSEERTEDAAAASPAT